MNKGIYELEGLEFMGNNFKDKLKFCGEGVRLYPLCKMIRAQNAELDNHCQIFDYVFIDAGKSLKIGKYSTLTWNVLIEGGAKTRIGDRVFLGPGTKLLTSTYKIHGYYTVEHLPEGCQETDYGDIEIEDDAYIGANCTIMPGVKIGEGAVVGVNSLVKRDLEPWTVYIGSPCRAIGKREKPTEERQIALQQIDWSKHL
ncbi:acyltransferase [Heliorestis acidaminivorans]|nr:acyltransferase [Heliorestis acidaminivorans]